MSRSKTNLNIRMMLFIFIHILIIVDILAITIAMFWQLPARVAFDIQLFDFCICVILLIEWGINFYLSTQKLLFLKQKDNIIDLIASIPFDVLLPVVIPQVGILRYLRLLKLLRVIVLFNRFFTGFKKFMRDSNLDKILGGVFFTIIIFTLLLYLFGSSYDLFDDFYFVIVTLTTVGYGDVTPVTFNEKLITILLIIAGVFIFSTITAGISSFLTDRLISSDNEEVDEKLDTVLDELECIREENKKLHDELNDLKNKLD